MAALNAKQTALSLGLTFALFHALWSVAVAVGFAQQWLNWKMAYHFVIMSAGIAQFSLGTAVVGVVLAFVCGAIVGGVFAGIWNWVGKRI
ncbi:hypothetical protein HY493_01690 [Candidatus Woesearchaeota archaeon]|nr:hypothetical protein [Candidatus Woesearchaeota archaeon]